MARIIGKYIRGAVGDVVFKTHGDIQILQARPRKKKSRQSKKTKKAASIFGLASSLAAEFRRKLSALVTTFYDGTMIFRLNTEVLQSLRQANNPETNTFHFLNDSFVRLDGFDFNIKSPLYNNLLLLPEVEISSPVVTVSLPGLEMSKDLKFPVDIVFCNVLIGCSFYDIAGLHTKTEFVSFLAENKKGTCTLPQRWEFELHPGCVCITAISLQYIKSGLAGDTIVNSKTFNPAAILKALVLDGEVDNAVTEKWKVSKHKPINCS